MKKQHKHMPAPFESSPAPSMLFDWDQVSEWLTENGKWLLLGFGVILGALLFYISAYTESYKSEADYFKAATAYTTFSSSSSSSEEREAALTTLKNILSSKPELHAAYDGLIAQTLINRGYTSEALPFANLALSRTKKNNLPLFTQFAETTLRINDKKFEQALTETDSLLKQLTIEKENANQTLHAFTLLRLAMLNQKIGTPQAELQSWQAWDAFRKQFPGAYQRISGQLESVKILLTDYAESRKKILKK